MSTIQRTYGANGLDFTETTTDDRQSSVEIIRRNAKGQPVYTAKVYMTADELTNAASIMRDLTDEIDAAYPGELLAVGGKAE